MTMLSFISSNVKIKPRDLGISFQTDFIQPDPIGDVMNQVSATLENRERTGLSQGELSPAVVYPGVPTYHFETLILEPGDVSAFYTLCATEYHNPKNYLLKRSPEDLEKILNLDVALQTGGLAIGYALVNEQTNEKKLAGVGCVSLTRDARDWGSGTAPSIQGQTCSEKDGLIFNASVVDPACRGLWNIPKILYGDRANMAIAMARLFDRKCLATKTNNPTVKKAYEANEWELTHHEQLAGKEGTLYTFVNKPQRVQMRLQQEGLYRDTCDQILGSVLANRVVPAPPKRRVT